jgi:hypothetical protein
VRRSTKPPTFRTRDECIEWWSFALVAHFGCSPERARERAEAIADRAAERRTATSKPLTASRNAPELGT